MFTESEFLFPYSGNDIYDANVTFYGFGLFSKIDIFVPDKSCIKGPVEKIILTCAQDTVIIPMYSVYNDLKTYSDGVYIYLRTTNPCHLNTISNWIELNKYDKDPRIFKAYTYMQSHSLFIDLKI